MRSPGINGEGELRGQPANPGSPGKMAIKTECVCVCLKALGLPSVLDTVVLRYRKGIHPIKAGCHFADGDDLTGALHVL